MNTPDTPTPRTDAEKFTAYWPMGFQRNESGYVVVASEFAQLERELTAAKEEIQLLQTLLKQRDSENAETLAEAVKIEDERNLLRKRAEAAEDALHHTINTPTYPDGPCMNKEYRDDLHTTIAACRATEGKK